MADLIRLQTPEFEFSVWANDISSQAAQHRETIAKRGCLAAGSTPDEQCTDGVSGAEVSVSKTSQLLCFSPAIDLDAVTEPQELLTSSREKYDELALPTPVFYENTQYQFEWVFLNKVTAACVTHRGRVINDAFRFSPEKETSRGLVPARLSGTIHTGNDVGWLRLPLTYEVAGRMHTQYIAVEVLPTKMLLHQDLPAMYRAIDRVYPLWRFSLVEKTKQDASRSKRRGVFPLMWLANFAALRERFEQGLKVICAAPHSRLQPFVAHAKAARLKGRLPNKLAENIRQDMANGQYDKRYCVEKKRLSVDTPENRFIKMAVSHSKRRLAEFEARLRQNNQAPENQRFSESFLNELHGWQQPLKKQLKHSFLADVGAYKGLRRESLVLQQKIGYSAVYRIWHELKFYLDLFGNQSSMSMKSVAEIYEIWCFLCLKQLLEQELGFELVENNAAKLTPNEFFEYQLKDGFAGAFRFKRHDGVTARLAHEPKFTEKGKPIRSYLVNQQPDIVLEVTLPKKMDSGDKKRFIWLFDAKYRIQSGKNDFNDGGNDVDGADYVPDDAINQMHRYRDALIHLAGEHKESSGRPGKKSRPVFGAFALYPGFFDQTQNKNPYASAIDEVGIGAFALLPSQAEQGYCGHQWLLDFLQAQIGKAHEYPAAEMAERLYVQDAVRIPYYGMRQVLYPDLTMTMALGGQRGRSNDYFERFKQGTAQWYHLPQATFSDKFKQHAVDEIRYLALAVTSEVSSSTKQIDKVWPVVRVTILPRYAITEEQAGKQSSSADLYYLFELGRPLVLQTPVTRVPHRPMRNSMRLTTLDDLESATGFANVKRVYKEALI